MPKTYDDPALVLLTNVRASFLHVFEPKASVKDGPKKFRGDFIMDPETDEGAANIKACNRAIKHVGLEQWDKWPIKLKDGRLALKDGNENIDNRTDEPYDGYADMMFVSASRDPKFGRVPVADSDKTPLTAEDGKPYGGCYVNALVRFYAVTGQDSGGNGVFAGLEAVQYVKKGKPFGKGSVDTDKIFDDVSGEEDEDEDEDDAPKKKKRRVDDDDDDDTPPKKRKRVTDDDDDDTPPKKRKSLF